MIEIKHKITGKVFQTINSDTLRGADLRGADLRGADLRGADLRDAYLQDAYLRGADLQGAYLRNAYLQGADLRGADLRDAYLQGAYLRGAKGIIFLELTWNITITKKHIQIGCQYHSFETWLGFTDSNIAKMDNHALEFHAKYRNAILALHATLLD